MLRDPTGLDGSTPPEDHEAASRAARQRLRRFQPGVALWLDLRDYIRTKRRGKDRRTRIGPNAGDANGPDE